MALQRNCIGLGNRPTVLLRPSCCRTGFRGEKPPWPSTCCGLYVRRVVAEVSIAAQPFGCSRHELARRFMGSAGVGLISALAVERAVDNRSGFHRSKTVRAYSELTRARLAIRQAQYIRGCGTA
jgi:hypothetical protein